MSLFPTTISAKQIIHKASKRCQQKIKIQWNTSYRQFSTLCATIWNLSNASPVVNKDSDMPLPKHSEAEVGSDGCAVASNSLHKLKPHVNSQESR